MDLFVFYFIPGNVPVVMYFHKACMHYKENENMGTAAIQSGKEIHAGKTT